MSGDYMQGDVICSGLSEVEMLVPAPQCADVLHKRIASGVYQTPLFVEEVARIILRSGDLEEPLEGWALSAE